MKIQLRNSLDWDIMGFWEADFFYFHEAVQDNPEEVPYYPYVILWAERENGLILNSQVTKPEEWADTFSNQLQENIEITSSLPHKIIVKKKELFDFLRPVTSKLGIKLNLVSDLELIDEIKENSYDKALDENEVLGDVMALLIEDESFQDLLNDEKLQELIEKGSIQELLTDERIQSLIEKKGKELVTTQFTDKDPEQATLFDDYNSN